MSKKTKPRTVFTVQRLLPQEYEEAAYHGDPERIFATRAAAEKYAADRTRAARAFTNPFAGFAEPGELCKGGMRAFKKLMTQLKLKPPKGDDADDAWDSQWAAWWGDAMAKLTPAERDVLWDSLTKFELYWIDETTLED